MANLHPQTMLQHWADTSTPDNYNDTNELWVDTSTPYNDNDNSGWTFLHPKFSTSAITYNPTNDPRMLHHLSRPQHNYNDNTTIQLGSGGSS